MLSLIIIIALILIILVIFIININDVPDYKVKSVGECSSKSCSKPGTRTVTYTCSSNKCRRRDGSITSGDYTDTERCLSTCISSQWEVEIENEKFTRYICKAVDSSGQSRCRLTPSDDITAIGTFRTLSRNVREYEIGSVYIQPKFQQLDRSESIYVSTLPNNKRFSIGCGFIDENTPYDSCRSYETGEILTDNMTPGFTWIPMDCVKRSSIGGGRLRDRLQKGVCSKFPSSGVNVDNLTKEDLDLIKFNMDNRIAMTGVTSDGTPVCIRKCMQLKRDRGALGELNPVIFETDDGVIILPGKTRGAVKGGTTKQYRIHSDLKCLNVNEAIRLKDKFEFGSHCNEQLLKYNSSLIFFISPLEKNDTTVICNLYAFNGAQSMGYITTEGRWKYFPITQYQLATPSDIGVFIVTNLNDGYYSITDQNNRPMNIRMLFSDSNTTTDRVKISLVPFLNRLLIAREGGTCNIHQRMK